MNKIIPWLKANKVEITRLVVLGLSLVNQMLAMRGKSPLPISDNDINYWVSTGITTVVSIWTFFKQNKFDVPEINDSSKDTKEVTK